MKISTRPVQDLSTIREMKSAYLKSLTAPLDGMWEAAFIDPSPHHEILVNERPAGYFAVNALGNLLQFYVDPAFEPEKRALFHHVVFLEYVDGAVAATSDPGFLSLCLDVQKTVTVNTYLYERFQETQSAIPKLNAGTFRLATSDELEPVVELQRSCLGGGDEMVDWLRGYSSNLIERGELFILEGNDGWIGLGECRRSDTQPGVADLGMMVSPTHRRKGWATNMLNRLFVLCTKKNLRAVCSTTVDNIGAQKAIERAGFTSRHRIMDITFVERPT